MPQGRPWWEELLDLDDKEGPVEEETLLEETSGSQMAEAELMEPEILLGQDAEEDMDADILGEDNAGSCSGGCSTTHAEDAGKDAASPVEEASPASTGLAPRDDEQAGETRGLSSGYDHADPTEVTPFAPSVGSADDPFASHFAQLLEMPVVGALAWESRHGPVSQLETTILRKKRGQLLKGILGPPKVDWYIREIMGVESRQRSRAERSSRRCRLGHQLAECIATTYAATRQARKQPKGWKSGEIHLQLTVLLRYACACLCNALRTWRLLLSRSLMAAFLPRSHWWLCDETLSDNSCTLETKASASKLQKPVSSSRDGRAGRTCGNFPNSKTKDETISLMEQWVQEGSDTHAEMENVLEAGVCIHGVIVAADIEEESETCQKLRRKEYLLSCDLANAANALIAALNILPPQALKLLQSIELSAHFVCISLFYFDGYREEGILSGLRRRGGPLGLYSSYFPVGNEGLLFWEDLIFGGKP